MSPLKALGSLTAGCGVWFLILGLIAHNSNLSIAGMACVFTGIVAGIVEPEYPDV